MPEQEVAPATRLRVGERFGRSFEMSESSIASFARMTGDMNPLHHDREHAAATRFGGIIASGTHYPALLLGLLATHCSQGRAALGLEYAVKLRAAVHAGDTLDMQWEVTAMSPNPKLGGDVVTLVGRIECEGRTVCTGEARVLITDRL